MKKQTIAERINKLIPGANTLPLHLWAELDQLEHMVDELQVCNDNQKIIIDNYREDYRKHVDEISELKRLAYFSKDRTLTVTTFRSLFELLYPQYEQSKMTVLRLQKENNDLKGQVRKL